MFLFTLRSVKILILGVFTTLEFTMSDSESTDDKPKLARSLTDLQRFKIEKLMKNPEKGVLIPERQKEKKMPQVPEFVRNVMGSSAGAGSGEFHVYRHLRRKEYARQKFIQEKGDKEMLDKAYHQKLLENKMAAEEKTAKKRAKRLKKKNKRLKKIPSQAISEKQLQSCSENSDSDSEQRECQESENESD